MLDDEVVRAALTGDVRAFEQAYRDIQPRLLRYLQSLVGQDAQDVAAETWLQAARDLTDFTGGAAELRAWVVTIGRHRALDWLRARGRRPVDPHDPATLPEHRSAEDAGAGADEAMATRRVLDLISRLPPDQAEAVLLRVVVGLEAPAAALLLGKRAGAVRMATSRGLAGLAGMIGSRPGVTVPAVGALRTTR